MTLKTTLMAAVAAAALANPAFADGMMIKDSYARAAGMSASAGAAFIVIENHTGEDDRLIGTAITDGSCDVMLVSSSGKTIRFSEGDVRAMGRTARGVRGIKMAEGFNMISLIIPDVGKQILSVSENGYGKRTKIEDFPVYGRGGQGVIGMQTSERNGKVVGAAQVSEADEIMLISDKGTLVRTRVGEVSIQGRNTQGVRLIRLKGDEKLVGLAQVDEPEIDELAIDDAEIETEMGPEPEAGSEIESPDSE